MIVIPMAGLSRRFLEKGYDRPKYMLDLHGTSVFSHAIGSFSKLFHTEDFLFIARSVNDTERFILLECERLGLRNFRIIILDHETAGQAETVEIGLFEINASEHMPVTVFNIDTFRHGFEFPKTTWFSRSDGYLEVFRGKGANWSYVEPDTTEPEPKVRRTTEKIPISDLCCNGLYHFGRTSDFHDALRMERLQQSSSELYVAPLYNHLLMMGRQIHYLLISDWQLTFCGIPEEYEAIKGRPENFAYNKDQV
ncbi:capsular biosynthesis protein [Methylobacterium radiotolerans]